MSTETIIRTARKPWECEGNGGHNERTFLAARACSKTIQPGERYAEYMGESHAYQSGSRHCMACAYCFGYVEEGATKGERSAQGTPEA